MSRSHAPAGRLLLACVLIALGSSTWGSDPVYKCRDHAGQAHYQASPCPTTQHTEWRREYPDKPSAQTDAGPIAPPTSAKPRTTVSRRADRRPRRGAAAQGAVISLYRDPAACERARQARERAHARLGLRRDFATSRRLDDRVHDACQ
jgi:hypothetical protein